MAHIPSPISGFNRLALAASCFAMFAHAGFAAGSEKGAPPSNAVIAIAVGTAESAATAPADFSAPPSSQPIRWSDIKDYGSDMRDQFIAGLQKLEATINAQLAEVTAKRATVKAATEAKALDQALTEMQNAHFFLTSTADLLARASPQTWEQAKTKVGLAWMKSQQAYAKVQPHTAS